jgi:hypothetical protein
MDAASPRSTPLDGPPGATPHFGRQRPDHSPPELLSDEELVRSIDSLSRKLRSARRMLVLATVWRLSLVAALALAGTALMTLGPAPIVDFFERRRTLVTTWDVFAWWFGGIAVVSVAGAFALAAIRDYRRRASGWRHRVDDLARRLAHAEQERRARGG